ncbi:hypothetical protein HYPSUDRAFT_138677 [Hypholoma sublateritium FD-334 SS-4]|uniref:Uncharacterized protein n=1 Tax=Hypholoma sublateritium (strain FD-334 SS-4) TaxID=945553 RepID=A0A0D2L707_HYPSF|nr:hypothetical protein HYPSUDRAFT_138677 [Hypholoma sublateritium FD-334 SS-4]
MSATTGQIIANFDKILTLPFVDDLKVTDVDGVESSVYTIMLNCKTQYEALQSRTVEIVRNLNSYSVLQDVCLEIILREFLSLCLYRPSYPSSTPVMG